MRWGRAGGNCGRVSARISTDITGVAVAWPAWSLPRVTLATAPRRCTSTGRAAAHQLDDDLEGGGRRPNVRDARRPEGARPEGRGGGERAGRRAPARCARGARARRRRHVRRRGRTPRSRSTSSSSRRRRAARASGRSTSLRPGPERRELAGAQPRAASGPRDRR